MILKMLLCIFSNKHIYFVKNKFTKRFYITAKVLPTIKYRQIINKKKYTKTKIDENIKSFIIYIKFLSFNLILIQLIQKA